MTWEQEMKEQAHFLAEEWAPIMAKDLAQKLAEEKAKNMAQDLAQNIAQELVEEKAKDIAKEAKAEGQTEKAIETAKNFLKKDIEPSVIAECTGLPLEQVLQLQKEVMSSQAK